MNIIPFQHVFTESFAYLSSQVIGQSIDLNEEINYLNHIIFNSENTATPFSEAAPWSVYELLLNMCRLGLSLNPVKKLAYVMPSYTETGELQLKLYPGYRGEIAIATQFNVIKNTSATLVYEKDQFRVQVANNDVEHFVTSLSIDPSVRGACTGGYCRSVLIDGSVHVSYMSIEELDAIAQNQIEMKMGNTPWNSIWATEMRRVALYRRGAKDWRNMINASSDTRSALYSTEY
ncbi:recombinase RecT [Shewanella frigidimarina]|jgi:recombinational DNA repair protein RecT|uniref:recombinase RecT n=1 Tax=Shewanella frigidimarina TaxID=56812 RepID=UPI003D7A2838